MAEEQNQETTKKSSKAASGPVLAKDVNTLTPEPGQDVGESQVQEQVDQENSQGFRGIKVDPTPNENYSATNSAAGNDLPTPETDQDLRREASGGRTLDGPAAY